MKQSDWRSTVKQLCVVVFMLLAWAITVVALFVTVVQIFVASVELVFMILSTLLLPMLLFGLTVAGAKVIWNLNEAFTNETIRQR